MFIADGFGAPGQRIGGGTEQHHQPGQPFKAFGKEAVAGGLKNGVVKLSILTRQQMWRGAGLNQLRLGSAYVVDDCALRVTGIACRKACGNTLKCTAKLV